MDESNKIIPTTISLFSSSISGALHVMIGYPFDTIIHFMKQIVIDDRRRARTTHCMTLQSYVAKA